MLLLPHHYEFAETLANLPFFYKQAANQTCETMHLLQKDPHYLPEMVNGGQLREYLLGEEVDQFIECENAYADIGEPTAENGNLLEPWELSNEWLGSI